MKIIFTAFLLLTLLSGCTTNRSIIRDIEELDQKRNGDISLDREIHFQQQILRYKLLDRGYLKEKVIILDISPKTSEWNTTENKIISFIKNQECKASLVDITLSLNGSMSPIEGDKMMLVIWDRPDSIEDWDNFAKNIKKANQQVDPIVTTPVDKVEVQGTQGHP